MHILEICYIIKINDKLSMLCFIKEETKMKKYVAIIIAVLISLTLGKCGIGEAAFASEIVESNVR